MPTNAQEQAQRVLGESEEPADATQEGALEPQTPGDRTRMFRETGLSRMKRTWHGADALIIAQLEDEASRIIKDQFRVAFAIQNKIHKYVRRQRVNEVTGELQYYQGGEPIWETDAQGVPVEDWGLLSETAREDLLYAIAIHMFEWELAKSRLWAQAMYAKVDWEVKFASAFVNMPGSQISGRPTIDDRTQAGHRDSAQERYFAVFRSAISRQADGLVSAMKGLQFLLQKTTTG
jgi:hypothetical protein